MRRTVIVAGILVAALALRVAEVQRTPNVAINDPHSYLELASQVARTGDYSTSTAPYTGSGGTRGPTALFPPAFPYLLALIDLLDGHTAVDGPAIHVARLAQAALGTVAVGLTGLVALEAFGETVALAALALAAVYPVMIETSAPILSENLLVVLELAAVWSALRIRRAQRPYRWVFLAGMFAGLASLTHQDGLVLLIPLAIAAWVGVGSPANRRPAIGIRRLAAPAVLVLVAALTIAPWTVRNAIELHTFTPVSDQAGETVLGTYNSTSAADHVEPYRWLVPPRVASARALVREAPRLREPAWEGRLLSRGLDYIGSHPLSPLLVGFNNARRMLELGGAFARNQAAAAISIPLGVAWIGALSFWVVAIVAAFGAFTSYARKAPRWLWLVPLLLMLSVIFVRMETPRFREPLDPFFVMLASCALATVATRAAQRTGFSKRLAGIPGRV